MVRLRKSKDCEVSFQVPRVRVRVRVRVKVKVTVRVRGESEGLAKGQG